LSHNYPDIFTAAGFQTRYRHELVLNGQRWLMMLVATPS
jgi:hypothetical protein